MSEENLNSLAQLTLTPYIQLATALIRIPRKIGGNMFRHQMATMTILIDYKIPDPVILKAAVIHDLIEDIPGTDRNKIIFADIDGPRVLDIVLELTRNTEKETKPEYLERVKNFGSPEAKIIKLADRISNITDITTDIFKKPWITNYIFETEKYILPIAEEVNLNMYKELSDAIDRKKEIIGFIFQSMKTAKMILPNNNKKKK